MTHNDMTQEREVEIAQILTIHGGHDQQCPFRQATRDLWYEMHRLKRALENRRLTGVSAAEPPAQVIEGTT